MYKYSSRSNKLRLKKLVSIVVIAAVVAAAAIGIAVSQMSKPIEQVPSPEMSATPDQEQTPMPAEQSASEVPMQDVYYSALVDDGYPAALAGLVSSDLEVVSNNRTHHHYIQSMGGGGQRELIVTFNPANEYTHTANEESVTLDDGTKFYVISKDINTLPNGYNVTMTFFMPYDSLSTEMKEDLGVSVTQQVSLSRILGLQYADAIDVIPEGGIVGEISESFFSEGTGLNRAQIAQPTITPSGVEVTRDLGEYYQETRTMIEETSQFHNERRVFEAAERIENDLATRRLADSVRAQRIAAGLGAAHVALTGIEVRNIVVQDEEMIRKLEALLDCAENPTNPLAIKAKQEDPNYNRATVDIIRTAIAEVRGVNTVRIVSTTLNAGIGGGGGLLGMLGMGAIAHAEDAILRNTIENYILRDVAKGVVPCVKCEDTLPPPPSSDGPVSGGQGEAPSSDSGSNYTPPTLRDLPVACMPNDGQLRVVIHNFVQAGVEQSRKVTFEARANVTNVIIVPEVGLPYAFEDRYLGEGIGNYHEESVLVDEEGRVSCTLTIEGPAVMKVNILRHMSGRVVSAEWMPGVTSMKLEFAEVQVQVYGNFTVVDTPVGCYGDDVLSQYFSYPEGYNIYGCSFFDVDERGGQYKNGSGPKSLDETNIYYEDCELAMGRLSPATLG